MYAESANSPVGRPSLPARLPVAAALIWFCAFLASAAPWFDQLNAADLIAAFWTFEADDYASVLAHFSWAPRVAMAVLIGCGLGLAGAVTQQILGNPLASPTTLGVESHSPGAWAFHQSP